MNFSYWEIKSWLTNIDFCIVGSGIVGLTCALQLNKRFPKAKILILEKGFLPQGASTKNAGFACFGSLSEIIKDLDTHSEQEVVKLVKKRVDGLQLLKETLGNHAIGYKNWGGYELFLKDSHCYDTCLEQISRVNRLLHQVFNCPVYQVMPNSFHFKNIKNDCVFNPFEGQIDTGLMMEVLLNKVQSKGIKILNNCLVEGFSDIENSVKIKTNIFEFTAYKLFIATNGFAKHLINEPVLPARAQVLITKPLKNLHIKGTFHFDEGYYYFRNIDDRILFGGGRNLDFKGEETSQFGLTESIQNTLETILKTVILPETPFQIEHRWSGIMGVGNGKNSIVKAVSNRVFCGVRLGGMGIAIGSVVGKELAELA
ncbi:NAD(P)/FAD-dependent oxidoreductase [Aestuariibaculum sediminum]|uniref:FAD-binding oxidoreductase n=1 Tax=Aestuariibaculum sediminum TaxID=2770637 RepID=A0A8J6UBS9_9FLAO|nr:FAD-binding oxidoreductase [Aestuariibaculum sediminum]MBD0831329.1 FAD-binding oxidoreductase [Aestuariibaculum sediminum]